jgi:SAM-dependent methyltransferase
MNEQNANFCPLCASTIRTGLSFLANKRSYHFCEYCYIIFADRSHLPDPPSEMARYLMHSDGSQNQHYHHFLHQLLTPMMSLIDNGKTGLDYGCGQHPVLAKVLASYGYMCDIFDPFFFNHLQDKTYDFITATECFEHFHHPASDIEKIVSILKPNGYLGIMTETWSTIETVKDWYYIRDFTHVTFYHHHTFLYLEKKYGLQLVYTDEFRVFIFKKV